MLRHREPQITQINAGEFNSKADGDIGGKQHARTTAD